MMKRILYILPILLLPASCSVKENPDVKELGRIEFDIPASARADTLRVITYNILNGMANDSSNGRKNFFEWVKRQNPDVLALQEVNNVSESTLKSWAEKWGHSYVVINIKPDDSYPVAITSRYPITVRKKFDSSEPCSHGCIFATVKGVNFVVLHLWAMSYPPGSNADGSVVGDFEKDRNNDLDHDGDVDGDDYRLHEVQLYMGKSIKTYTDEKYWLMMGDFNSSSPDDRQYLSRIQSYAVHEYILGNSYIDLIRTMHPGVFCRSFGMFSKGEVGGRYDFIYGTEPMNREIVSAGYIYDDFTEVGSDHYPAYLDFRIFNDAI